MKDQVLDSRIKAHKWDLEPTKIFSFSGRVLKKYGLNSIKSRLSYANNEHYDIYDRLKNSDANVNLNAYPLAKDPIKESLENHNFVLNDQQAIVDMEVPSLQYEKWLHSVPMQDIEEYKKRKLIMDHYLENFSEFERSRVIKIMCENGNLNNYVGFLELDPNLMNTQQKLIYKDIIKFYDNELAKENLEREQLWQKIESSFDSAVESNKVVVSVEEDEQVRVPDARDGKLASILKEEANTIEQVEELKLAEQQAIEETLEKEEQVVKQVAQEEAKQVRTLNLGQPKIKTLLFSPTTTTLSHGSIFGASHDYAPSYDKEFAVKGYTLNNDKIARVGYNNNIADLIEERNAVALANERLVQEIIQNQIMYNNQFGNGNFGVERISNSNVFSRNLAGMQQSKSEGMMSILTANANSQQAVVERPTSIFARKISVDNGSTINSIHMTMAQEPQMSFNARMNQQNNFNSASRGSVDNELRIQPVLAKNSVAGNTINNFNRITNNSDTNTWVAPKYTIPKKVFGQPASMNANQNVQPQQQAKSGYISPASMYKNPNIKQQAQQQVPNPSESVIKRPTSSFNQIKINNRVEQEKPHLSNKQPVLLGASKSDFKEPVNGEKILLSKVKAGSMEAKQHNSINLKGTDPKDVVGMYKLNIKNRQEQKQPEEKEKTKIMIGQFVPTKKID